MANRKHPARNDLSRRDFLKATAGTAATVATIQIARQAYATGTDGPKIRIGVVGGNYGSSFYWHRHPNAVVTAVCDIRKDALDRLSSAYLCETQHVDFHKILADKSVDAIALFVPADLNASMASAAMKAGKHVICAAPAGVSLDECRQILEIQKQTAMTYMMADPGAFRREIITARDLLKTDRFGPIIHSEFSHGIGGLIPLQYDSAYPSKWRKGFFGLHFPTSGLAALLSLTGERVTSVTAYGWNNSTGDIPSPQYRNAVQRTVARFQTNRNNTVKATADWYMDAGGYERGLLHSKTISMHFPSDEGVQLIHATPDARTEEVPLFNHYTLLPETLRIPSGDGDSHTHITHEFVTALLQKRTPRMDVYDAVACTAAGLMADQSALNNGKPMTISMSDNS